MVEIKTEDYEWAAIDRMGKMLISPHPEFKTTQTYSTFSSILCWTVQRLRTLPIQPDTDLDTREGPLDDPDFHIFDTIQKQLLDSSIEEFFGELPTATHHLNTLYTKDELGRDITALEFLISLRNAVAHGDGRKVKPVNRPNQLVGFEFTLSNPKNFPQWSCVTQLNRSAMAQIAGKMADVFCESFRGENSTSESDLNAISESE